MGTTSTAMDSKMALQQEDIVSWIEEFSYIYSSGLFDLDDIQLSEENECHSGKAPSEDDLVRVYSLINTA